MATKKTDIKGYIKALRKTRNFAIPNAVKTTLDITAFDVRKMYINIIGEKFILRNKWTAGSIRVIKAKANRNISLIQSETGSVSPYMEKQEKGGTVTAKGSRLPIPTEKARVSESRGKPVSTKFRMNRLGKITKGRKAKFFIAKFRREGIYTRKGKRLVMIRNLEKSSVTIKAVHSLTEATNKEATERNFNRRFILAAEREMKRV